MRNVVGPSYLFIRAECSFWNAHEIAKFISKQIGYRRAQKTAAKNSLAKRANSLVFRSLDFQDGLKSSREIKDTGAVYSFSLVATVSSRWWRPALHPFRRSFLLCNFGVQCPFRRCAFSSTYTPRSRLPLRSRATFGARAALRDCPPF